ncbi:MAG TPA: aminotransferase class III-fold pyridoxal phosphate-dependent enzyme [Saprospiraceae bacterium]|nr:aminotransferase class III-fold pyridoxal phosphate-dependent enzyme [Saprospiraceae bacterium]
MRNKSARNKPIRVTHSLAAQHFNLIATATPLPGEIDQNFLLQTADGQKFTLKIAHPDTPREYLEFQHALIHRLHAANLGLAIPLPLRSVQDQEIVDLPGPQFLRVLHWIEGRCLAEVNPHTPELLEQVGAMCGKLSRALEGFDHPAAHRFLKWDVSQAEWTAAHVHLFEDPAQQSLARYFYQLFAHSATVELRQSVCYNDANDYNILVSHDALHPTVPGVIDFGDAVYTHTINDLAIACAYCAMHKPDPLSAIAALVRGYHTQFPLTEAEAGALFARIGARLLISVTCSAQNRVENPENTYLQISDQPAWTLLQQLRNIPPALAHATIRHACGWEPCPQQQAFRQWLQSAPPVHPLVATNLQAPEVVWLDLSVGSPDLGNYADIEDADRLHRRIAEAQDGAPGIGRYNEVRPFYTTDAYAVHGNNGPEWRSVHIGLDVFLPLGTPVFAPLAGKIHSFQDNAHERDYGPTIILEHQMPGGLVFYTLYGHLTRTSLEGKVVGQSIAAGESFCQIGPMPENGNWSPHLHFQVILDILDKTGDYPGVAFPSQRAVWTSLCPDPWLLLTSQPSPPPPPQWSAETIQEARSAHLGKNLSLSYQRPLHMLRGWRQYLFDHQGRRYLDTVNNVAHVGHEHPRVVRAGQRQMAVLNTNTRYLHENIVRFSEALLETFPPELSVAFLVNSGSEANELAMRLAKTYTGQRDMLTVEIGYHGNTQACVDVSSYKFDGPGGSGAPAHTHVTPIPDTYRGLYRGNTPETGLKYAAHMGETLAKLRQAGRGPAAFLCESVISCGGQVPLPPGYLQEAVRQVRAAGGLYIADEVQTGCGRHGTHFWAFAEHGVVPDIVTIGKPIGNGHPLGVVVTTRAIADAFANGMEYFNTFGGNPVSAAIGLEVLRVIQEEGLQQNALETGDYLLQQLRELARQFPLIGDVRGAGLFLGFELVQDPELLSPAPAPATYLANRMRELGILMSIDGPHHNVLKIKPPLVFSRRDADFLVEGLGRVLREDGMRG